MPIHTSLWKVNASPKPLTESTLSSEKLLEDVIVAAPELVNGDWMLIGRQENTGFGGIIDLLAIAPDGSLILIEIKRDRTPREVVAQALDYAVWVQALDASQIYAIYTRYSMGGTWNGEFYSSFGHGNERLWEEAMQYGFICGGGGAWYSRTFRQPDLTPFQGFCKDQSSVFHCMVS